VRKAVVAPPRLGRGLYCCKLDAEARRLPQAKRLVGDSGWRIKPDGDRSEANMGRTLASPVGHWRDDRGGALGRTRHPLSLKRAGALEPTGAGCGRLASAPTGGGERRAMGKPVGRTAHDEHGRGARR
jgi:hypothetical protein